MKSSRRKQTNPNRVSSGVLDPEARLPPSAAQPDSESKLEDNSPSQIPLDAQENENSRNDSPSFPERQRANNSYDMPMDLHVSSFSCSSCPEVFGNADDLREHKNEVHGQQPTKKMRMDEGSPDDFPTAYHRLGRELSETDLPLPNGHLKPSETSSASPPMSSSPPSLNHAPFQTQLKSSPTATPRESGSPSQPSDMSMYSSKNNPEGNNGELSSNSKSSERIFHMDAYCDLCDREFCNKYFLKTHKANKHGIYEDSSPPIGSVPLPMPGLIGPGGQEQQSPFNFKMDPSAMKHQSSMEEPLLPWSFKLDPPSPMSSKKPTQDLPQPKSLESPLPMFPLPLPNIENSKYSGQSRSGSIQTSSPDASRNSSTSMLSSITNSIKAAPPLNDPSMEDYCHICQKHFCNKYYLKKHKQDVHGIAPETPPNSSNKRSRSSLLDSMPMSSSANPMIMPQGMPGLSSMPNIPGMPSMPGMPNLPGMPNMPPGVMVLNPYHLPPVAIIPAGSLMPGQQIPPHHPMISQPMPSMSMSESSMAPNSSIASSSSSASTPSSANQRQSPQLSGNKPPSLSQEDGAVHCNICGKEFCNEFYLHVHKESKHKIPKEELVSPRDSALPLVKDKRPSESNKSSPPPLSSTNQSSDAVNVPPMSPHHLARPESGKLACNMCNKDFNDFYSLHSHRIQEHGFPDMSDGSRGPSAEEEAMRNRSRSLARMAADASAVSNVSGFGPKPDNKSQDSAICDICNKEMTNQYFLRLHRFNVHGIDPTSNEKFDRKPLSSPMPPSPISKTPPSSNSLPLSSPSSQQPLNLAGINPVKPSMLPFLPPKIDFKDMPPFADFGRDFKGLRDMPPFLTDQFNNELFARSQNRRHLDLNFFGFPSMGKMPGEENVKLNFDPEAYCDICKKEFCSKYFLRTHKQNIHGIKCDVSSNSPYSSKISEMDKLTTTTSSVMNMNGGGKPKDLTEKSSWKWKEPVNSSRVVCDICNKEVCNKYFLRTHKFKKHGIPPTSQSPNMSLNGSPVASDCDTASNASSQPDEKPFRMDSILNMPQMIPLPPSDRLGDKFQNKNMNHMKGKDINQNNNGEFYETCNVCRKRFKNAKMLKEHIWKHHSVHDGMDPRAKNAPPIYPCQVCGIDFPAELSVQLHLIQEHNARVTLDTEEPQIPMEEPGLPNEGGKGCAFFGRNWGLRKSHGGRQRIKKFFCARCEFSTVWLSSLLEHEKSDHSVAAFEASGFKCKYCQQMESSLMSLSNHLESVHGKTHEDMCEDLKDVKFEPFTSFKCSHCPAVFPSHPRAVAHFREVHIRSRHDLNLKRSFQRSTLHCSSCSFKTHFLSRLRRHAKSKSHKFHIPKRARITPTPTPSNMLVTQKEERNSATPSPTTSSSSIDPPNFLTNTPPTSLHLSTQDASDSHEEDGSLSRVGVPGYKNITPSMLSPPDCDGEHRRNVNLGDVPPRRDDIVLQTYSLPISPVVMDTPASFKLSSQPSGTSAVVGL